jgi:DNA ligase (NAD+)
MATLKEVADQQDIPIDGLVITYDSISYSRACGRTSHHYKDGLAFKFGDDAYETVFRSIEWVPNRTGEIAPIALFDTVEIDGCGVSSASLHNLTFIKGLELAPGCRILVSKRNMIIPHIEENLDRGKTAPSHGQHTDIIPDTCPCCGGKTRIHSRGTDNGRTVETLHCDNPDCGSQILRKFRHFASKKAMDLSGISEATLAKFIGLGYLNGFQDIYHLDRHREEIIRLEGSGEKSYEKLWGSIEQSRGTTFVRYLVAMDIPMIGRTASRGLDRHFGGDLDALEAAALGGFDFTSLNDFGETLDRNIHGWFSVPDNLELYRNLQKEMKFEERKEDKTMNEAKNGIFEGRTIVATGKLEHFTRDSLGSKIVSLGATAGSSVTKDTDYLICGEKAGSKLAKAQELGVTVLTEQEFLDMPSA